MEDEEIVFYLYSTSNHNCHSFYLSPLPLYSIFILHQTTTDIPLPSELSYCILSLFYIKPQLLQSWEGRRRNCILSLFYIKPQQQNGNCSSIGIVFYLYSTSNHNLGTAYYGGLAIVFYLYSTSNHNQTVEGSYNSSIVFYLYSTSNHNSDRYIRNPQIIVFYLYSTSNHNLPDVHRLEFFIVFYLYSTSNHNFFFCRCRR